MTKTSIRRNLLKKDAVVSSVLGVLYQNQEFKQKIRFKVCKEMLFMTPVVIYTRKNYYLLNAISSKLEILKSSGLINFWQSQDVDVMLLRTKEVIYPESLKLSDLMGVFSVLFLGLTISSLVLVYEILKHKLQ